MTMIEGQMYTSDGNSGPEVQVTIDDRHVRLRVEGAHFIWDRDAGTPIMAPGAQVPIPKHWGTGDDYATHCLRYWSDLHQQHIAVGGREILDAVTCFFAAYLVRRRRNTKLGRSLNSPDVVHAVYQHGLDIAMEYGQGDFQRDGRIDGAWREAIRRADEVKEERAEEHRAAIDQLLSEIPQRPGHAESEDDPGEGS